MITVIRDEPIPLCKDQDGVIRILNTRVTLDSVIYAFQEGSTPEEIAQQFTSLELADIYATITYYLRHLGEVNAYLQEQQELSKKARQSVEVQFPPEGIKTRLLARKQLQGG